MTNRVWGKEIVAGDSTLAVEVTKPEDRREFEYTITLTIGDTSETLSTCLAMRQVDALTRARDTFDFYARDLGMA